MQQLKDFFTNYANRKDRSFGNNAPTVPAFLTLQSPPQESVGRARSALDFYRQSEECKAFSKGVQEVWLNERGVRRDEAKVEDLSALRGHLNRETARAFRELDAAERTIFVDQSEQEKADFAKQRVEIVERDRSQSHDDVSERRRYVSLLTPLLEER